jgi:hypothetical protein
MSRILLAVALFLAVPCAAPAELYTTNSRLDHALWPEHDQKLVIAGEIGAIDGDGAFEFRIAGVILGADSFKGQTLKVPARSFLWPQALTPFEKGASCILVLRPWAEGQTVRYSICTVVPGRKRDYRKATGTVDARAALAEELLGQLKEEKSERRQRVLLLQLAPVLGKDKTDVVDGFVKSADPWVRRSALAALIYATEDPKYLEAAARDVQDYMTKTKETEWVASLEPGVKTPPRTLLLEHYFFLEPRTWTFGSRWDEKEADKHLRIWNGMLKTKVIDDDVRKRLVEK